GFARSDETAGFDPSLSAEQRIRNGSLSPIVSHRHSQTQLTTFYTGTCASYTAPFDRCRDTVPTRSLIDVFVASWLIPMFPQRFHESDGPTRFSVSIRRFVGGHRLRRHPDLGTARHGRRSCRTVRSNPTGRRNGY